MIRTEQELEHSAPGTPTSSDTTQPLTAWHVGTAALLVAGYSAYYFCRSDYSVALPLIVAEQVRRGVSAHTAEVRLGSIASFGVLAYALGKVPAGALADRFGGRRNFLGGMAGAILFTLLCVVAGGFPLFTLAWVGNRFVQSMGWPGLVKITSRWFSYSVYGTVMAVLSLSYLFGDALSREVMSVLLAAGMGWRGLFLTGAGVLSTLLLINLLLLKESPVQCGLAPAEENPENLFANSVQSHASATHPGSLAILRRLFSSYAFWLVCMLSLGATLLRETFSLWTPTYFTQFAHMTSAQAASGSAIFPFFGGISVLLAGWLSDFFGKLGRAIITFAGLLLAGCALLGLASLPQGVHPLYPLVLVGLVALLLIGPYSYLSGAISLDFGGKDGGATASGVVDSAGYLAGVLSGNGMARIAVEHGWHAFFLFLAVVALLSSVVAAALLHQQRGR